MTRLACWGAQLFGHPIALFLFPLICLVPIDTDFKTFLLSVLAISTTQMVLIAGNQRDVALHAKLDALIHAVDGAPEELERAEDLPIAKIEELRP